MSAINRLLKIIAFLAVLAIIIGMVAAVWAVYYYIPGLRTEIHDNARQSVVGWFPLDEDGSFSFDIDISFSPKRCRLTNIEVDGGKGAVLEGIEFRRYGATAGLMELDMEALLHDEPSSIVDLEDFKFEGDIYGEGFNTYFTPERSGISNVEWDYDDFTGKVILKVDLAELQLGRITVTGTPEIKDGKELIIGDPKYRHIHGPVAPEVASFIEDHTDLGMKFSFQGYELNLDSFKFNKDKSLHVELSRK